MNRVEELRALAPGSPWMPDTVCGRGHRIRSGRACRDCDMLRIRAEDREVDHLVAHAFRQLGYSLTTEEEAAL
jgi:hypothetical protein